MEALNEGVWLSFDPPIESVISDHIDVPELVLVGYGHLWPIWNQVYVLSNPGQRILIRSCEVETHIFNWSIFIVPDKIHLLVQIIIQTFEILQGILLSNQFS